jgi:hypothetical protein
MAFTQGDPLPDVTKTTTTVQNAPSWYTPVASGLGTAATTNLARTGAQSVAGLDPLQTKGYGQIETAAKSYVPGLTDAEATADQAALGINYNQIQNYMDPYRNQVVNEMARLGNQNFQRNVLPGLTGQFVGTGGLGGQRYANALGQTAADYQSDLTGKQYGALSAAYKDAVNAAKAQSELQNQAALTQGKLAGQEQELGLTGAGALTKAGGELQKYQQSILDAPALNAKNASDLLRGYTLPTDQTVKFVGPDAGSYGTSDLSQILGIGTMLGATKAGSTGSDLFNWLGTGIKGLTNTDFSKFFSPSSNYTINGGSYNPEN